MDAAIDRQTDIMWLHLREDVKTQMLKREVPVFGGGEVRAVSPLVRVQSCRKEQMQRDCDTRCSRGFGFCTQKCERVKLVLNAVYSSQESTQRTVGSMLPLTF